MIEFSSCKETVWCPWSLQCLLRGSFKENLASLRFGPPKYSNLVIIGFISEILSFLPSDLKSMAHLRSFPSVSETDPGDSV